MNELKKYFLVQGHLGQERFTLNIFEHDKRYPAGVGFTALMGDSLFSVGAVGQPPMCWNLLELWM